MPKINFATVPVVQPEIAGPLEFEVEGQGKFAFYLKEPDFPTSLGVITAITERVEQWCRPGADAYPLDPPVLTSERLWESVCMLHAMLCGPGGAALPPSDVYTDGELLQMSRDLPAVFVALGAAASALYQKAEEKRGNWLGSPEAPSSESA